MPIGIIVFIILFLMIFYVYTFWKLRKKKKKDMQDITGIEKITINTLKPNNEILTDLPIDFVDKNQFHADIQKEIHPETDNNHKIEKKALTF